MNDTQTSIIREIIKDVLSPAGHFARLKAYAVPMEMSTWQEIGTWYEPDRTDVDCAFVHPEEIRDVVTEICTTYNATDAAETVLAYLYLKHRALFLTHEEDFHGCDGQYYRCVPLEDYDEYVTGYGYCECSAAAGDIVDFSTLDPAEIPFHVYYPVNRLWAQLRSDHQLGLGLINYAKAANDMANILCSIMANRTMPTAPLLVLDNIGWRGGRVEEEPCSMINLIALVVHACLLQALQAR